MRTSRRQQSTRTDKRPYDRPVPHQCHSGRIGVGGGGGWDDSAQRLSEAPEKKGVARGAARNGSAV
jgi:hypothetical protein